MQELNLNEIESVNGGFYQYVASFVVGLAGSYAYDAVGGKSGIDSFLSDFSSANSDSSLYTAGQTWAR
ncbi:MULTISPECIES: class IIb bacteriocin, lactobin A/cerein 7B family [Microbulbifer]|uniref:class IIb bacteriocin, lactobin A/cerein 7B family n=1 Tax=Microbulbifer TaxID=48073 RepID=UPI000ACB29F1|nr:MULTISPECIES: class IIb bacteriocin, lactobin A/cerein 7B family [Microbulbifer]